MKTYIFISIIIILTLCGCTRNEDKNIYTLLNKYKHNIYNYEYNMDIRRTLISKTNKYNEIITYLVEHMDDDKMRMHIKKDILLFDGYKDILAKYIMHTNVMIRSTCYDILCNNSDNAHNIMKWTNEMVNSKNSKCMLAVYYNLKHVINKTSQQYSSNIVYILLNNTNMPSISYSVPYTLASANVGTNYIWTIDRIKEIIASEDTVAHIDDELQHYINVIKGKEKLRPEYDSSLKSKQQLERYMKMYDIEIDNYD